MEIEDVLTRALSEEPHVAAAWLFGSRARGTARANSDVDVAVLWTDEPQASGDTRWRLEAELSLQLQLEVQVVPMNRAPADLVRRVLRDGHLLVDRDPSRRVAFEVRKRNEYFDMTPIWRQIRHLPDGVEP